MNSETQHPSPNPDSPHQPDAEIEQLRKQLAELEQALLDPVNHGLLDRPLSDPDGDTRKPAEKLDEVSKVAKVCAKEIDRLEIGVLRLEDTHSPEDQQLLAQRIDGLRERVYQSLRTLLASRQNEAQQELVATLATLLDNNRSPLPGPSVN